ncbi:MAG: putative Transcriptional repressor SdpR [Promethearchaeota archaeon]|nr:MAG: putative Transcriptional repressor SdpR [Candidatus Lokiarchaeota archaeon]
MREDRFKNYIKDIETSISCDQFLEENQKLVEKIQKKEEFKRELLIHKALSKRKRLIILKLLKNRPMCTCALAKVLGTSDGTITHHLNILKDADLIFGYKKGYYTIYQTKENLQKYLEAI